MDKPRVLVDTCVVIEAFRINCWKALCNHFAVEMVDCCVIECSTGDPLQPGRIEIPREELMAGLTRVHQVDDTMLAKLRLDHPALPALDDGELHLLAWLHANPREAVLTVISTTDSAAIRATHVMALLDRVTSLQQLGQQAGLGRKQLENLESHFEEDWLSNLRLKLKMNIF